MRITCQRLRHILELTQPALNAKSLPATQSILCKDGFAVSNNLELAIAVELPELRETEESFMLPHKVLQESLRFRPDNSILEVAEGEDGKLTVKCDNPVFSSTFVTHHAEDFPDYPVFDEKGGGEVDGDLLLRRVAELLNYASKERDRPILTGICITLGEELEMAAADGNRLAWRTLPITLMAGEGQGPRVVVPATAFRTLAQLWRKAEKRPRPSTTFNAARLNDSPQLQVASLASGRRFIVIGFGDDHVSFGLGELTLVAPILEGAFPDYMQLVPAESTHKVVFDAGEAYRALRQLVPMADNNIVRLKWTRKSLTMSATGRDVGDAEATVTAATQGRASVIALDLKYLLEILKGKEGQVLMETTTPRSPARFTHSTSPNIVIMPIFVRDQAAAPASEEEPQEAPPEGEDDNTTYLRISLSDEQKLRLLTSGGESPAPTVEEGEDGDPTTDTES